MTISVKLWDRLTHKHDIRDIAEARTILERVNGDTASYIVESVQMAIENGCHSKAWQDIDRIADMMNVKTEMLISFWFIMTDYDVWED